MGDYPVAAGLLARDAGMACRWLSVARVYFAKWTDPVFYGCEVSANATSASACG